MQVDTFCGLIRVRIVTVYQFTIKIQRRYSATTLNDSAFLTCADCDTVSQSAHVAIINSCLDHASP